MLLMPHVYEEVTRNNHLWELKAVMIYFWHRKGMEQNSDVTHNWKVNKHTLIPFTDKTSSKSANIWVPSSLCIFFTLTLRVTQLERSQKVHKPIICHGSLMHWYYDWVCIDRYVVTLSKCLVKIIQYFFLSDSTLFFCFITKLPGSLNKEK